MYLSVSGEVVTVKIIEKSRFITTSRHVEGEEQAKAFIEETSAKYSDATHNCYAYICDKYGNFLRFSDNGEPQGTAGMPMLEVICARLQLWLPVISAELNSVRAGLCARTRVALRKISIKRKKSNTCRVRKVYIR